METPPQTFRRHPPIVALVLVGIFFLPGPARSQDLSQWAVAPGFALEIDSRGFDLPAAVAAIPEPGKGPDAPLYFVAELRGEIKVVTRDRSVHSFARVPTWGQQDESLSGSSQQGLAGLCLAPEHGFLFATYTDPGEEGVMRNRVMRFASRPGSYGLQPDEARPIGEVLADFQSAPAHQIGNCAVRGEEIYIGVGDGGDPAAAGRPEVLLGKVVCMRLDGSVCDQPPLGIDGAAAYVWASGLRNPFGLAWVEDELFVAENGIALDRFVRIERGRDYLWQGSDQSIAALADLVFVPTIAPVQLDFIPGGVDFVPPDWNGRFITAGYGGRGVPTGAVVFSTRWDDPPDARLPSFLLEYLGPARSQHLAGVSVGPDGIYLAPMLPMEEGRGAVLRMRWDPDRAHPVQRATRINLHAGTRLEATARHGCTGCHTIADEGGGIGPSLDHFAFHYRITERLESEAYRRQVERVDALEEEPFVSWSDARREVLAASGLERTRIWLEHFLLEPRFDDPEVQMQNPNLSREEAEAVHAELWEVLGLEQIDEGLPHVAARYARRNWKALSLGGAGAGGGVLVVAVLTLWLVNRRRNGM